MAPPPLPSTEVYRLASLEELTASLSLVCKCLNLGVVSSKKSKAVSLGIFILQNIISFYLIIF